MILSSDDSVFRRPTCRLMLMGHPAYTAPAGRVPSRGDPPIGWLRNYVLIAKEPLEQRFSLLAALLGQPDGFVLVLGIGDQAFLMEPIERCPVVPLPGAGEGELTLSFRKTGQVQQRQHSIVDLVSVRLHNSTLGIARQSRNRTGKDALLPEYPPSATGRRDRSAVLLLPNHTVAPRLPVLAKGIPDVQNGGVVTPVELFAVTGPVRI